MKNHSTDFSQRCIAQYLARIINLINVFYSYLFGSDKHIPRHKGTNTMQHKGEVDEMISKK